MSAGVEFEWPPSQRVIPKATPDEARVSGAYSFPAVGFNNEEALDERDLEFHRAKVRVGCPNCGRRQAPLLSKHTRFLDAGWQWQGISHQEPYQLWLCRCPGCHIEFRLETYTPQ